MQISDSRMFQAEGGNNYRAQRWERDCVVWGMVRRTVNGGIVKDLDRESGMESKTLEAMLSTGLYSMCCGRFWRFWGHILAQSDLSSKGSVWLLHWAIHCKGTREKSRRPFRRLLQQSQREMGITWTRIRAEEIMRSGQFRFWIYFEIQANRIFSWTGWQDTRILSWFWPWPQSKHILN